MKGQNQILVALILSLLSVVGAAHGSQSQVQQAPIIRGTVLAPGGVALLGASVSVRRLPSNYEVLRALLDGDPPPPPVAVARVDSAGRFALVVPTVAVWQVRVEAPGFVPMRYGLLPAANGVELPVVTLRPSVVTPVEVTDSAGVGLAGIAVRGASADNGVWKEPPAVGWRPAARRGRSDAAGRLRLLRARGERLDLFAYPPAALVATQARRVRRARMVLAPIASQRTLEVRETGGGAIAGVIVALAEGQWPLGRTGVDGRLELSDGAGSSLNLLLLAPDGRTRKVELPPVAEGSKAAPTVFRLAPTVSVEGRIAAARGGALASVLVWPSHDPGRFVLTDSRGRYAFEREPTRRLRLQAHGHGRPPLMWSVNANSRAVTAAEVTLAPGRGLSGRVVDSQGLGVAAAAVAILPAKGERKTVGLDRAVARAVTDAEGRFSFSALPAVGNLWVRAVAREANPVVLPLPALGEKEAPQELVLTLSRGRIATGLVIDTEEQPIASAEVRIHSTAGKALVDDDREVLTGSDGRFAVSGLQAGVVDLLVTAKGYAPATVHGIAVAAGHGRFELGTLVLEPGVALRGQVVDAAGQGVAAKIWVEPVGSEADARVLSIPTEDPDAEAGAEGRFVVDSLAAGVSLLLTIDAAEYLPQRIGPLTPPLAESLQVILEPAVQLSGRVTDAEGGPIAAAKLELHPASPTQPPASDAPWIRTVSRTALTDSEGQFQFEDVAPGRFEVEAYADGFQPAPMQIVELVDEAEPEALRFVLETGAVLTGQVLDSELEPVASARVRLGRAEGLSDTAGKFRVAGIIPGSVSAVVERAGFDRLVRELDIELGVSEEEFILQGGYAVSGRVVDGSDLPLGGAEVELEVLDADLFAEYRVRADQDGAFLFDRVAQGEYRVRGRLQGYAESEPKSRIRVVGAKVDDVEVHLQRGGRIEGEILGLDFDQLAQVEVRATAPERRERVGEVDFEGRFSVVDLEPDDWTVKAQLAGGQRQARARVTLAPGVASVSRDLEFGRGVTLSGLVLYAGAPVRAAQIDLRSQSPGERRKTTTDFEGRFRLEELQPGTYQLGVAHHGRGLIHNEVVSLASDRELLVEIETAAIVGSVVDSATGAPVDSAIVSLLQLLNTGGEGSKFSLSSDAQGLFQHDTLPGGRFRLLVQRDGYQATERTIEAPAGGTSTVRVELEPAAGLDVVATLSSGATPRYITLLGSDSAGRQFTETRAGFARGTPFPTLPAGEWNLLVSGTGGGVVETRVTVPSEPLQVALPAAGRLRVRVPDLVESESPATLTMATIAGQPFRHLAFGGLLEESWRLAGGRVIVEGVPAGQWMLRVQAADGRTWSATAASTGGPDIDVSLE